MISRTYNYIVSISQVVHAGPPEMMVCVMLPAGGDPRHPGIVGL